MHKKYIIADTHFGHKNIAKYSPCRGASNCQEHTEILTNNWNRIVNKNDTVFCLGDFAFNYEGLSVADKLNGNKVLIMGNHDTYKSNKYLKYFNKLLGCLEYKDCILTHIPIHESQLDRYRLNIHGHLHNNVIDDPRYINVSCEQINSTPILLDSII